MLDSELSTDEKFNLSLNDDIDNKISNSFALKLDFCKKFLTSI